MAYGNPIRVLVLHDDPVAREGLTSAFSRYADMQVIDTEDESPDFASFLSPSWTRAVDVVVADFDHGMELAALSARRTPGTDPCKVLIVAGINREWEIRSALECGVRGYVLFGCALDELAAGVRAVHRGLRHLSSPVALRLAEILAGDPLTAREEEVLRLVVEGMGNKAIARRLGIAIGTVKSHLKGIFDKLHVESRTQAICAADRRGLLRAESQREPAGTMAQSMAGVRPQASGDQHRNANGSPIASSA